MDPMKEPVHAITYQYDNEQNKRLNEGRKFYKPFILRTPVLSTLLLITLVLIAVVELACRRLPDAPNRGVVTALSDAVASLNARQADVSSTSSTIDGLLNADPAAGDTSSSATSSSDTSTTETSSSEPADDPATRTRVVTTTTTIDGTMVLVEVTQSYGLKGFCDKTDAEDVVTQTLPPSDCTNAPVATVSAWLIVGTRRIIPAVGADPVGNTGPAPGEIVGGGVSQPADGNGGGAAVGNGNGNGNGGVDTVGNGNGNGNGGAASVGNGNGNGNGESAAATPAAGLNSANPAATPVNTLPAATETAGTNTPSTVVSAAVVTNADGTLSTMSFATITTGPSLTSAHNSRPTSSASTVRGSPDGSTKGLPEGAVYFVFSQQKYFEGAFLPTLLAILFTIPWGFVDVAARQIEPYIQLAGSGGTGELAKNSLCLDYDNTPIFLVPFKSILRGHGIVFIASILNLLALLTAPLAVESIFIGLQGTCDANSDANLCFPTLSVFRKSARVLEAVLGLMALLLILIIILNRKRSSGVFANPHSIAATATLFHSPALLETFRGLPTWAKEKELKSMLRGHSYGLGYYPELDGTTNYGFLLDPRGPNSVNGAVEYSHVNLNEHYDERPSTRGWVTTFLRFAQVITFMLCLIALLGVILFYRLVSKDTGFERFMSSQGFGVRFLFTTVGVVICQVWFYIRSVIHLNEPYHNLLSGKPSSAQSSVLVKPTPIPLLSVFRTLRRGAFFLAFIDFSAILCELLTVALANIPFSSGNTYFAYRVCTNIAIAVICIMLITLFVVLLSIGRFGGGSEVPTSIAGRMKLLVASRMVERWKGLGAMGEKERDRIVCGDGERFRMGRVTGWDGTVRLGIDFEEFVDRD